MRFDQMPYRRPDTAALTRQYSDLARQAATADSPEALLALYKEAEALETQYATMASLAAIHHTQDTRDEVWKAEQDFFDEADPAVHLAHTRLQQALCENAHSDILRQKYGEVLVQGIRNAAAGTGAAVLELQQEENALVTRYLALMGGLTVEFDGKTLNMAMMGPYLTHTDPAVRRAACNACGRVYDSHAQELDDIFDRLVHNRNRQARALGYADYSQLGYVRMNRIGYGPKEVACYREQVARDLVPLIARLQQVRFARIGCPGGSFCDDAVFFADGNAAPKGTPEQLFEAARRMYHELSAETGEFIDYMLENQLFDVMTRPGKASGGYCDLIAGHKAPFIFANWNGTSADIDVLTHEAGHAFEVYLASRNPDIPAALYWPGTESCEIHSMSMEFLTSPWHHLFFGQDTARYQLAHAEDSLFFLPYGCMVDEFQHIVYQNEALTPAQRHETWLKLERKYRPWLDLEDLPFFSRGAAWQRQIHIYEDPFYYIDYCLAQTVALQFFAAHLADPADAWQRYLALTRRGGMSTYRQLVETAGFVVPFEDGSLKPVGEAVAEWIRRHQI